MKNSVSDRNFQGLRGAARFLVMFPFIYFTVDQVQDLGGFLMDILVILYTLRSKVSQSSYKILNKERAHGG